MLHRAAGSETVAGMTQTHPAPVEDPTSTTPLAHDDQPAAPLETESGLRRSSFSKMGQLRTAVDCVHQGLKPTLDTCTQAGGSTRCCPSRATFASTAPSSA